MKPTIVIVDDVDAIRRKLTKLLEKRFDVVGEARNGNQACHVVEKWRPKLVTMDVTLPQRSGIEATKWILHEVRPKPRVVMVSGVRDEVVMMRAYEAGASDYVFKPFEGERLIDVLESVLAEKREELEADTEVEL